MIPEVVSVHKHKSMHKHNIVVSSNFPTCSISVSYLSVLSVVTIGDVAVVVVLSVLSVFCVVTIGDVAVVLDVILQTFQGALHLKWSSLSLWRFSNKNKTHFI